MEMYYSASTSLSSGSLIEIEELFESSPGCCISRVPINLRKINEEAYTPQLISIGPFHKDKTELFGMEKEKRRYNKKFIQRLADNNSWEQLRTFVENHEQEIRQYYSEPIEFSSAMFVEMILCDAVFIIELLRFYPRDKDDVLLNKLRLKAISRDLLLFENQIPYFVLEELYNLAFHSTAPDVAASAIPDGAFVTPRSYTSNAEAEEATTTTNEQERATIHNPEEATIDNQDEATTSNPEESTTNNPNEVTTSIQEEATISNPEEATIDNQDEATTSNPNEASTSIQEEATTSNPNEATNSNQEEAASSTADEASTNKDELLSSHCFFPAIFYLRQGLQRRAPNNEEIEVTTVGASTIDPDRELLPTSFLTLPYHFFVLHGCLKRREIKVKHFTDLYGYALVELEGANTEGLHPRERFYAINIPEDSPAEKDLPNAVKLQEEGVKFKRLSTKSLFGIDSRDRPFPFFNGVELRIPCIEINDDTESLIRNLMALEQCHYPSETYLCSYMELMNSLIYSVEDVNLLVKKGIIKNLVGENLVIVDLFNKLRQQIPESVSHYSGFYKHHRAYYGNRWTRMGGELRNICLRNPWRATAAVVGAILFLSALAENIVSILWYI